MIDLLRKKLMQEISKIKENLRKLNKNIFLACTPGYDEYLEEFSKNLWRLNVFVDMENVNVTDLIKIRKVVEETFIDYNIIVCAYRKGTMEYWIGEYKSKNILLFIMPVTNDMKINDLRLAYRLVKGEFLYGNNFLSKIMFSKYEWHDFEKAIIDEYIISYIFLTDKLPDAFRIGMLKAYFLEIVVCALYCKGELPNNKNNIEEFFRNRFLDKKMLKIIDNFYNNKYNNVDTAVKNLLFFSNKLFNWPGLYMYDKNI